MTADEIRKWHDELSDLEAGQFMKHHEVVRARARIEIAAQLAEINEKLNFVMTNGGAVAVDVRQAL